jgi:phospholipid-translocating ATPase
MIMSLVLFETEFLHIVSISFTALVLNELIMVALQITTWYDARLSDLTTSVLTACVRFRHVYMAASEVVTLSFYIISMAFLPEYFGEFHVLVRLAGLTMACVDLSFVVTIPFGWKVAVIVAVSALPLYIIKLIRSRVAPAASSKLL